MHFRPHYWLSDEWFTPDGVPGIAVPFYLAHPRLARLELSQMLEVEGGERQACLRILRHEVGHAVDNAYALRRLPTRRRLFGPPSTDYPEYLHAEAVQQELRPASRSLVCTEPSGRGLRRNVRRLARPAVDVGDAVRGVAGAAEARIHRPADAELAPTAPRRAVEARGRSGLTAAQDAAASTTASKREHYGLDHPDFYDSDLRNLFSDAPEYAKNLTAARFVRKIRREVRGTVASFTDSYQYTIDQLLEKIIERCRALNLRLTDSEEATKIDFMVFLTVQTMNYLHSGRHRVAL